MTNKSYDFKSAPCMLCGNIGLAFVHNARDDNEYWAAKCDSCGYVQLTPTPTAQDDEKYYKEDEMNRRLVPKSEMNDIQLMYKYEPWAVHAVNIVKEFLPEGSSIFEIGSGYGWLVEKARAAGYIVEGVEISDDKCRMAMERANIKLNNFNLLLSPPPPDLIGSVDAVCMFYVLEHIKTPVEFLKCASAFLKEKGKIIVEVPNFNAYMKQYSTGYNDFQYFRGHLSYFTPDTLKKVMEMSGFSDVHILGKQFYSVENAIHWARNNVPFKPYCQLEVPEGLEFVNDFYKLQMEKNMTSDMLIAVGTICN